jgi:hypothetical protein
MEEVTAGSTLKLVHRAHARTRHPSPPSRLLNHTVKRTSQAPGDSISILLKTTTIDTMVACLLD